jgi:hypothetical protein
MFTIQSPLIVATLYCSTVNEEIILVEWNLSYIYLWSNDVMHCIDSYSSFLVNLFDREINSILTGFVVVQIGIGRICLVNRTIPWMIVFMMKFMRCQRNIVSGIKKERCRTMSMIDYICLHDKIIRVTMTMCFMSNTCLCLHVIERRPSLRHNQHEREICLCSFLFSFPSYLSIFIDDAQVYLEIFLTIIQCIFREYEPS